ncbi:MAG: hypothetical protein RIK87_10285 [Fuerstiella sp.]
MKFARMILNAVPTNGDCQVIAHRGVSALFPENTRAAFADGAEADVMKAQAAGVNGIITNDPVRTRMILRKKT